jgi:NADH-quinone oxidoreductase subunit L
MGGEQDIRRMGGLKKYMPTTHLTFLIGTIAISGIPPLAGFFSKDQIIAVAFEENMLVFVLLSAASALTAFYMFRLYFLTFHGSFRGTHDQEHHLHESPKVMTIPLVVLAVLSIFGGLIGFPHALGHTIHVSHWLDHFLEKTVEMPFMGMTLSVELMLMLVATIIAASSIYFAYNKYVQKGELALEDDEIESSAHKTLAAKYYFDELYDGLIRKPIDALSAFLQKVVEPTFIEGLVKGVSSIPTVIGNGVKLIQNGKMVMAIFAMVIGLIFILITLL